MSNCNRDLCKRHIPVVVNAIKRLDNTLNHDRSYVTSAPITVIEADNSGLKRYISVSGARELVNNLYEREVSTVTIHADGMMGKNVTEVLAAGDSTKADNIIFNHAVGYNRRLASQYYKTTDYLSTAFGDNYSMADRTNPWFSLAINAETPTGGPYNLDDPFNLESSVNKHSITKIRILVNINENSGSSLIIIPDETFNGWLNNETVRNEFRIIYTYTITSSYSPYEANISQFLKGLGISDAQSFFNLLPIDTETTTFIPPSP